ncbi:signal transduction protein [Kibdelosporangium aridum]|uniref:Signal transduction protein n=1 Tax=Kibdelosporangium aridum TaxID=2030 RepID=A0A428Z2V5_KIBAR|nr:signal transduction protein [Kibdelosporangium aridum]
MLFGAAALAGPAAALAWPGIATWPVVIGYEVALFITGVTGGVLTELKKRWQDRAANQVDQFLIRHLNRFGRRYRNHIRSALRFIDLKGLATMGFFTPDLDDVFVDVSLDYRNPHEVPTGLLAEYPAGTGDRLSIEHFLDKKQPAILAMLGAPGSGKTTLLRYTARHAFKNRRRKIPILLYLRDHVSIIVNGISLANLARKALMDQDILEPAGWFEQKLRRGRCLVLLDGLDEVARDVDRRRVSEWADNQIKRYPKNDFVLASRPQGYRSAPIDGAAVLQVRSFTDRQIQRFIRGWYLAVEKNTTKGSNDEVAGRAEAEAEDLLGRLHKAPALAALTVNPLLLTMIANVHKHRGALPGSRSELYGEICQVMLVRRQQAKKLDTAMQGDKKESVLRELAYTMMESRVRDLGTAEVLEVINNVLRRISRTVTADEFLADVSSNGLVIERENGLYAFAHHTFQEFLTALHIREKGLVQTLVDNVNDTWWRETTLLYTARSDADPIVRACLADNSVTALSLAFDCAEQDSDLDPGLHEQLNKLFAEALLDDADVNRRSLAANVLTTRLLQETVRTPNGTRVCPNPITRKVYYLFRQDVPGPWPDGFAEFVPDDKPVTGIWPKDLNDFIKWVNSTTGTEKKYRKPTWSELDDRSVKRAIGSTLHCAWVTDDRSRNVLWTPSPAHHPHVVSTELLAEQIRADITKLIDIRASITKRRLIPTFRSTDGGRWLEDLVVVRNVSDMADPAARFGFALTTAVQAAADTDLPEAFVLSFIGRTNIENSVGAVLFDDLAELVRESQRQLLPSNARGKPPAPQWINVVAEKLVGAATPFLSREHPLDRVSAAVLRITALCLAADADHRYLVKTKTADAYRMVAAGLLLMERRLNGQLRADEAIVLATD